jgi:signal transduction histidine kinase
MKIRTQFAWLVCTVTLVPVLLVVLGWITLTLNRDNESMPAYGQLSAAKSALVDKATWEKLRHMLENRPRQSVVYIFNDAQHMIYSSVPGAEAGSLEELIRMLKTGTSRDIVTFQPRDTDLWVVLALDASTRPPDILQSALLWAGMGLAMLLIVVISFSIGIARSSTEATVRLVKAVGLVAGGDLETAVEPVKGNDEIRRLGTAVEQMRLALREENARQSRFVMGVSHDLKTPMALIKGYVELLRDDPGQSESARESHFSLILDKVDQLDAMIDHLIDYGRINTGEWQQTWSDIGLSEFLQGIIVEMTPDAKLLERTLTSDIHIPESLVIRGDRRSIRRCLDNLLNNALRYTPQGGTVGLSAMLKSDAVVITVWDTGPGISESDLPHVFELFYRGTSSRRETGMGMGLAIVKTIVDSHGWSIRADSAGGALFTLQIPIDQINGTDPNIIQPSGRS